MVDTVNVENDVNWLAWHDAVVQIRRIGARADFRSITNDLRAETGCQREPTMALGLRLIERPNGEQFKRFRPQDRLNQSPRAKTKRKAWHSAWFLHANGITARYS